MPETITKPRQDVSKEPTLLYGAPVRPSPLQQPVPRLALDDPLRARLLADSAQDELLLGTVAAFCHRVGPQTYLRLGLSKGPRQWQTIQVAIDETDTFSTLRAKVRTVAGSPVSSDLEEAPLDAAVELRTDTDDEVEDDAPAAAAFVLRATGHGDTLRLHARFYSDTLTAAQRAYAAGHCERLLDAALQRPDAPLQTVELIGAEERHWQMVTVNQTARPYPEKTTMDLVEAAAARRPDHAALRCAGAVVSHRTFQRRANALAWRLQQEGVVADQFCGIYMPVSNERLIAVLGIWKAGGAFVPLELTLPGDRMAYMLQEAKARIVVCGPEHEAKVRQAVPDARILFLDDAEREDAPPRPNLMDAMAYVMYTSGSTGRPKGVPIAHRLITNFLVSTETDLEFTPDDVCLSISPLGFDVSVCEIWNTLIVGGTVVPGPSELRLGTELGDAIATEKPTVMLATPPTWALLVQAGWTGCPTLRLMSLGDKLPRELADKLRKLCQRVYNAWGTTETTVYSTYDIVREGTGLCPVGRPIANTTIYILGPGNQLLPVGVPGEICIGGVGVFPGYLNRDELTQQKLVCPFPQEPDNRVYRTGDLARYLPDGNIEILGRIDNQLKIRGYRVEPGEIETVLRTHSSIADAAVVPHTFGDNDVRLVAYWTAADDRPVSIPELRDTAAAQLPGHMVPARFIRIDHLPLNANGKVDRRTLASLPVEAETAEEAAASDAVDADYVAPRTPLETQLATLWQDALHLKKVGVQGDFYELGGDSLITIRLMSAVMATCHIKIPTLRFMACRTIAEQAALVESLQQAQPTPDAQLPVPAASSPAAAQHAAQRHIPTSFTQQFALRLANQNDDAPFLYRMRGPLNVEALEHGLASLVQRHAALRTQRIVRPEGTWTRLADMLKAQFNQYSVGDTPYAVVSSDAKVPLQIRDCRDQVRLDAGRAETLIRDLANELNDRPIDYRNGPIGAFYLLRLTDDDQVFCLRWPHVVSDGWSWVMFLQQLEGLYNAYLSGDRTPLPPPRSDMGDYVRWERDQFDSNGPDARFWRKRLGPTRNLGFLTHMSRHRLTRSSRIEGLNNALFDRIQRVAQQASCTVGMLLVAAVAVIMHRTGGDRTIGIGLEMPNRLHPLTQDLMGTMFFNLPIYLELSGSETFLDLLETVKRDTAEAYDHQMVVPVNLKPLNAMVDYVPNFPALQLRGVETTPVYLPSCDGQFSFPALPYVGKSMHDGAPVGLVIKIQCYADDWAGLQVWDTNRYGADLSLPAWLETILAKADQKISTLMV